jgi:hypothetical protein
VTTSGSESTPTPKTHASAELLGAMGDLLAAVRATTLDYDTETTDAASVTRSEVDDQLSDYILPRLVQLDAPLLAVVGGSTGAGKSTLVNSIVGDSVTEAGILRPTTRSPVLVHHPDDAEWFERDRLLPDLARVEDGSVYGLRLVATDQVPAGLAVLDAPDVDSIDRSNRDLATQLLAAADLWLFVTSAARYADQVPWEYLRRAGERATSVAVVLDRTPDEAIVEVRGHLARMMTSRGLSDSPLFTVTESELDDGRLPAELSAPITTWLHDLAADPAARRLVVGRTLDGAVRHIILRTHDVADAMDDQIEVAQTLHDAVESGYRDALTQVVTQSADGTLMTGEVMARWNEFVGSGDLVKSMETGRGSLRERFSSSLSGKGARGETVVDAVDVALTALLVDRADAAAERVAARWAELPPGRNRLDRAGGDRASADLRTRAGQLVEQWRTGVTERARRAAPADSSARIEDGATAALLTEVLVLASPDLERHSSVGRGVLDAVLGAEVVTNIVRASHDDLVDRVTALLATEQSRFASLYTTPSVVRDSQTALREAARGAEYARHMDFVNGQITA